MYQICVAMSHFLVTAKNTVGPGWPSVATASTSMVDRPGTTTAFVLSRQIITNIQPTRLKGGTLEIIVVPGKREGIDSHCFWFLDKIYIYPIAY